MEVDDDVHIVPMDQDVYNSGLCELEIDYLDPETTVKRPIDPGGLVDADMGMEVK